jgi:hypothetical protein
MDDDESSEVPPPKSAQKTPMGPPLAKMDDLQEDEGDNDADVDMSILDMSVLDETLPDADAAVGTQRRRISVARRLQGSHTQTHTHTPRHKDTHRQTYTETLA